MLKSEKKIMQQFLHILYFKNSANGKPLGESSKITPLFFLQLLVAYSKGTGQTDHKVVIQEVSSERIVQELKVIKVLWIS